MGWGGVETKGGRRKECAGVERAQALEWGSFVFKAQVSHLLRNFGQGAQLLGAGVPLPVNRNDYTIDTDGKEGVRSEDDVSDVPSTPQTPRNGNLCRLTRMYLRNVSVRWGKCVAGSSCKCCPFSLDSISVVKKTLCSFRFLRLAQARTFGIPSLVEAQVGGSLRILSSKLLSAAFPFYQETCKYHVSALQLFLRPLLSLLLSRSDLILFHNSS